MSLSRHGPLLALLALVALTGVLEPAFLRPENLVNILRQQSFVGILAVGMTVVIIAGGIDLSVGALMALSAGGGVWVMNTATGAAKILADNAAARARHAEDLAMGISMPLELPFSAVRESLAQVFTTLHLAGSDALGLGIALATTLAIASFAGLVSGTLIAKGRLAPFIATLGGLAAFRSLALALGDGGEFRAQSTWFNTLGAGGIPLPVTLRPATDTAPAVMLTLPYPVLIFFALAAAVALILARTRFGRHVYALGSNERAAVYSGTNTDAVKLKVYLLMGFLTGVAGFLLASRMNSVSSSTTGNLAELDAIAAVVIGGTRMTGGSGRISGTLIGVLILGVISNMLNFLNVSPYLQGAVKGAIIVAAVLLQRPTARA